MRDEILFVEKPVLETEEFDINFVNTNRVRCIQKLSPAPKYDS